jgi:hypothetical protein
LGLNVRLYNFISSYIIAGAGYNYYKTTFSPTDKERYYPDLPEKKIVPAIHVKAGLTFDVVKMKKQSK